MIVCLSLSHHTAPLELRERLSLGKEDVNSLLVDFACGQARPAGSFSELAVLPTCNRLELYACAAGARLEAASSILADWLSAARAVPRLAFEASLRRYADLGAAEHLCRVASGLESMVLGEPQILGQVAEAGETAHAYGAAKQCLSALFRSAVRAGKRARTETAIGRNPSTYSSVAIRLAEDELGPLSGRCALVVGAGEMGALFAKALHARGVQRLLVANRSAPLATELAGRCGGEAVPFEHVPAALELADLAVVSTGSPQAIITVDLMRRAIARRGAGPLVLVDVAVPRNVAPEVGAFPGVRVLDLDELQSHLQDARSERAEAVPQVEAIVAEEVAAFGEWLRGAEALALIADLHRKAEAIRQREFDRTLRNLPGLDPRSRQHIHCLTRSLVDKMLHEPTERLRIEAGSDRAAQDAAVVRRLFGLGSDAAT